MNKIKGPIWYTVPLVQPVQPVPTVPPVPSNNTFSSFQKGRFTQVFLKPPAPFSTPIKPK